MNILERSCNLPSEKANSRKTGIEEFFLDNSSSQKKESQQGINFS